MSTLLVLTNLPDRAAAERLADMLVEKRLAACVNILGPCRSIYRWQGAVENADEVAAVFKTTRAMADTLIARVAALHSYDVPCVVQWPVDKLIASYAEWVETNVG